MDMTDAMRNRRQVVVASAITAALAMPLRAAAAPTRGRAITQRGIVGGGTLPLPEGQAVFSFFASRLIVAGEEPEIVLGSVRWVDFPSGLTLSSVAITDYEVIPADQAQVRRIVGTMSVNGEGEYPFTLEVTDAGDPGNGQDAVALTVGVSAGGTPTATPQAGSLFDYQAAGLITGDIHDADFAIDLDAGTGTLVEGEK